ncbi:hypothetical protein P8605_42685, partial [Streptomyces sp. T-3]|nr:hypothetical protein [Streptomyces sp. T-3]
SAHDLKVLAILAEAGCDEQVARLTKGTGLVKQVRGALRDGELKSASDALQAALASDQAVPQQLYDDIPRALDRYRSKGHPDLYAAEPGGAASASGTVAAYYLLA